VTCTRSCSSLRFNVPYKTGKPGMVPGFFFGAVGTAPDALVLSYRLLVDRHTPYTIQKNPSLSDTVRVMQQFAREGAKDLEVLQLVKRICSTVQENDYNSEIYALYAWVCRNIRYMRDIHEVETVMIPRRIVEQRSGDCDDMATLLAAMMMACGNPVRFLVVGFEKDSPSHVFVQVRVPGASDISGGAGVTSSWVTLDPVAGARTIEMHGRVKQKWVYPC